MTMIPGGALDALVAEKVMGLLEPQASLVYGIKATRLETHGYVYKKIWEDGRGFSFLPVPNYSTDISTAWEVVNKIQCHEFHLTWEDDFGWQARFGFWDSVKDKAAIFYLDGRGDTAAHAICMAALKVSLNEAAGKDSEIPEG